MKRSEGARHFRGMRFLLPLLLTGCFTSCLVEGTLVATPDGPRPIEELLPGDAVVCREGPGRVVATRRARRAAYRELTLDRGGPLRVTREHPVWSTAGWTPAGELRVGDVVEGRSGPAHVTAIVERRTPVDVYDLTVAPFANFYAENVLVHNKSMRSPPLSDEFYGDWIGFGQDGTVYRLTLASKGRGGLAAARVYGEPLVSIVETWGVFDWDIEIRLRDGAGEAWSLKGHASAEGLWLKASGGGNITFLRNEDFEAKSRATKAAIAGK